MVRVRVRVGARVWFGGWGLGLGLGLGITADRRVDRGGWKETLSARSFGGTAPQTRTRTLVGNSRDQNQEPGTRNQEPRTKKPRNQEPRTKNQEPRLD